MLTDEDKAQIDAYITHRIILFYECMKQDGELVERDMPVGVECIRANTKEFKRPEWDWAYSDMRNPVAER